MTGADFPLGSLLAEGDLAYIALLSLFFYRTTPSSGLEAVAYSFFAMRPAR